MLPNIAKNVSNQNAKVTFDCIGKEKVIILITNCSHTSRLPYCYLIVFFTPACIMRNFYIRIRFS